LRWVQAPSGLEIKLGTGTAGASVPWTGYEVFGRFEVRRGLGILGWDGMGLTADRQMFLGTFAGKGLATGCSWIENGP
jgi:hypothetical protein